MSTKDELEKVALERDALQKAVQELNAENGTLLADVEQARQELVAFQAAAQEQAEKLKAACPPESGFSLNVQFSGGKVISGGQITFRTSDAHDWRKAFDEFAALVKEREWKFAPAPTPATPPAENRALVIAREEGASPAVMAQVKQATEGLPPPPDGKTWLTLDAERILLLPQPDTRIKIEFYAEGHKFPDLKTTWKAEQVAGLLKHVTAQDVTKAADLALPCRVYYTLGKEYTKPDGTKGNYKDIAHVRPL